MRRKRSWCSTLAVSASYGAGQPWRRFLRQVRAASGPVVGAPGRCYSTRMRIDGIILAAGLSSRMGANKLRLPFRGAPLLRHAVDLVAALPFASRILVTRPESVEGMALPPDFRLIFNDEPEKGQSSSLRLALSQARGDAYLFFTGDQPLLNRDVVERVLAQAATGCIVVPRHAGRPGNPALFPAAFRDELLAVTGDRAGRVVREAHPDRCLYVEIEDGDALLDVDTPEEYEALLARVTRV